MPQHTKQTSKHYTSDNESGGSIEDGVEGVANADTMAFILSLSSKFPSLQPLKISDMTNHNEESTTMAMYLMASYHTLMLLLIYERIQKNTTKILSK